MWRQAVPQANYHKKTQSVLTLGGSEDSREIHATEYWLFMNNTECTAVGPDPWI